MLGVDPTFASSELLGVETVVRLLIENLNNVNITHNRNMHRITGANTPKN
jgi:hypothetical protein